MCVLICFIPKITIVFWVSSKVAECRLLPIKPCNFLMIRAKVLFWATQPHDAATTALTRGPMPWRSPNLTSFMPSHTPDGRGCPAGHRGGTAQGVRHTRRGEGVPIARPEAVEGVAVGCAVARRWRWFLWRWLLWMWSARIKKQGKERRKARKEKQGKE